MIEELQQNVETEIEILREISNNLRRLDYANPSERKLLMASVESLRSSLKLINNSIPKILEEVSGVKKLPRPEQKTTLEKVEFKGSKTTVYVMIESKDRETLLNKLSINEALINRMKKKKVDVEEKIEEKKAPRGYLKISNRLLLGFAQSLIDKGHYKSLSVDIRKANIDILFSTYVAMMFFTTLLTIIFSVFITFIITFFDLSFTGSFINQNIFQTFQYVFWIPLVLPIVVYFSVYYYPSLEKDSLSKKIDRELPFAVIHMSAISGSGIEPSELFKIIGLSKEYPYLRKEIRKVLNQINLYGYDLVTSLNNVSKSSPSNKLAELFSGLSTTITSGSNLQNFFEKRAETLMNAYQIERESYIKLAEMFMDIYIAVVIAAPMILMIVLILILKFNIIPGVSALKLTALMIAVIALINLVFITIIHIKQPNY